MMRRLLDAAANGQTWKAVAMVGAPLGYAVDPLSWQWIAAAQGAAYLIGAAIDARGG